MPGFIVLGSNGLWCLRKTCQKNKTCMHTTDCKGMTHEEAALKQTAREAAIARREHQTEMERYETQSRLLVVQQKLSAAGLELDDLIELIEARQNGRY